MQYCGIGTINDTRDKICIYTCAVKSQLEIELSTMDVLFYIRDNKW